MVVIAPLEPVDHRRTRPSRHPREPSIPPGTGITSNGLGAALNELPERLLAPPSAWAQCRCAESRPAAVIAHRRLARSTASRPRPHPAARTRTCSDKYVTILAQASRIVGRPGAGRVGEVAAWYRPPGTLAGTGLRLLSRHAVPGGRRTDGFGTPIGEWCSAQEGKKVTIPVSHGPRPNSSPQYPDGRIIGAWRASRPSRCSSSSRTMRAWPLRLGSGGRMCGRLSSTSEKPRWHPCSRWRRT